MTVTRIPSSRRRNTGYQNFNSWYPSSKNTPACASAWLTAAYPIRLRKLRFIINAPGQTAFGNGRKGKDAMKAVVQSAFSVEGNGPPLFLIHGVGGSRHSWDGLIAQLRSSFRCISYDLRGHGRTPKPPTPYALEDFV